MNINIVMAVVIQVFCTQNAPESMSELIKRWESTEIKERTEASAEIVKRYDDWSDEDLKLLKDALQSDNPECAARAGSAIEEIKFSKLLGRELLQKIPDIMKIVSQKNVQITIRDNKQSDDSKIFLSKTDLINSVKKLSEGGKVKNNAKFFSLMLKDESFMETLMAG